MRIKWLSHAAFELHTSKGVVLIDPFLNNNPLAPIKPEEVREAELVIVTHDHFDHLGDAVNIAKRTGAKIVALPELALSLEGVETVAINMGSYVDIDGIKVALVQAFHTCSRGFPAGCLVSVDNVTVYHAGDTSLFGDMKLIGELYRPDVALLPIGGYYTMGPREAAVAANLIKPKVVIPMHYATFPVLVQKPDEFLKEMEKVAPEVKVVVLRPGEAYQVTISTTQPP
ncbi:MAG: metal-dependent hydrolase [Thermoprotei archaeon]|nr:MAG: metal-dependent hydrolase [Thermoprotei archaeon]RLF16391.1 MAG: metal-dependent hydrolase [Thermoprotei archaeon]